MNLYPLLLLLATLVHFCKCWKLIPRWKNFKINIKKVLCNEHYLSNLFLVEKMEHLVGKQKPMYKSQTPCTSTTSRETGDAKITHSSCECWLFRSPEHVSGNLQKMWKSTPRLCRLIAQAMVLLKKLSSCKSDKIGTFRF